MKVAITVPHFSLDIGRNESGLATGLGKLGHEATVITTDFAGGHQGSRPPREVIEALPYGLIVVPRVPGSAINPVPVGIQQAVRQSGAELLHSSEDTDMLTVFAFRASRYLGLPFVLSTERYYIPKFPKSMGYLAIERVWTRRIRREAEAVTTHSTIQQSYWGSRGLSRADIQMIPVGVWTEKFEPGKADYLRSRFNIPHDATLGFSVGRMTEYKDYPTMLRAMRAVLDRDSSVHLVVVGFGPDRARVLKLAHELRLGPRVVFPEEKIPHSEIPAALRSCDFYLQSSSVEPFGIAVVEAMSTGTPVVVTDVGGMSDTVVDGMVGRKVPPGDSQRLADAILEMRDADLRARMGKAGRERAVSEFDWMVVCKRYADTYARAMEARQAKSAAAATNLGAAKPRTGG